MRGISLLRSEKWTVNDVTICIQVGAWALATRMGEMKMDAGNAAKEASEEGFRLLDKVTEYRFAMVLLSVAIALDVALAWVAHRNILSMDWTSLGTGTTARLGLASVAYALWMAVLSQVVRYVVESVGSVLTDNRLGSMLRSIAEPVRETSERRYTGGRVPVTEAKLRALKDKDSFWIAQVEKAEALERQNRNEMAAFARLSFSVLGLMLMDWGMREYSIMGEILSGLNGDGGWMEGTAALGALAFVFLVAFPWLYQVWNPRHPGDAWMEHPELARECLDAIVAQRRQRSSEFQESVLDYARR